MKRILMASLVLLLLAFMPAVSFASGTNDYGTVFSDLSFVGHQYVDDDDVITCCDFIKVQTSFEPIDDTDTYLNFVIPYIGYSDLLSEYVPDQRSTVYFYDEDGDVLYSLQLHTLVAESPNQAVRFMFDLDTIFEGSIPTDLTMFSIKLIYKFGEENSRARIPSGFSDYLHTYFVYGVDYELVGGAMDTISESIGNPTVYYYSELEVYALGSVTYVGGGVSTETWEYEPLMVPPDPVKPGYNFAGWRTSSGALYTEGTTLLTEEGNFRRIYLYATWIQGPTGTEIDEYETPGALVALLNLLGLNSAFGKILTYVVVLLVLIAIFVLLGLPLFAIAAMILVLTAFFIVMGWLPAYAAILFGGTSLVLMFISFKTGGVASE
jgi:uncharacterized repeat protein (TIGR02543 family)